jgi:hypothetical protein
MQNERENWPIRKSNKIGANYAINFYLFYILWSFYCGSNLECDFIISLIKMHNIKFFTPMKLKFVHNFFIAYSCPNIFLPI